MPNSFTLFAELVSLGLGKVKTKIIFKSENIFCMAINNILNSRHEIPFKHQK